MEGLDEKNFAFRTTNYISKKVSLACHESPVYDRFGMQKSRQIDLSEKMKLKEIKIPKDWQGASKTQSGIEH